MRLVEISYIYTLHINLYVAYPFDKNQSNSFPCFTLFFPAFHDDVNAHVIGSLIEREISFQRNILGFQLKRKWFSNWSDKFNEIQRKKMSETIKNLFNMLL